VLIRGGRELIRGTVRVEDEVLVHNLKGAA
jgi:hypothetical protein